MLIDSDDCSEASDFSKQDGESMVHQGKQAATDVASKESAIVKGSKWAVYLVILLAALGTGIGVFYYLENEEKVFYLDEVSCVTVGLR